jgi:hypothetical protein
MNTCKACGQLTANPKFCSRSCSITHSNKTKPKKQRTINNNCRVCGKPLRTSKSKHCSHACYSESRWRQIKARIDKDRVVHSKDNYHSSNTAKRYIQETLGPNCSVCGLLPEWNNQPLTMILDHINGVPNDWRICNLRLVCHNCDSQLPTYKSKNKSGGRPHRRI